MSTRMHVPARHYSAQEVLDELYRCESIAGRDATRQIADSCLAIGTDAQAAGASAWIAGLTVATVNAIG